MENWNSSETGRAAMENFAFLEEFFSFSYLQSGVTQSYLPNLHCFPVCFPWFCTKTPTNRPINCNSSLSYQKIEEFFVSASNSAGNF
jgi:hypothetical protein